MPSLTLFNPSGVVLQAPRLRLATRRLQGLGFDVSVDDSALARAKRFAGDDDTRLAAVDRVAKAAPDVALAVRGGYGLSRLLPRLPWKRIASSVGRGTRWVGHSDFTALQCGLFATTGAASWSGPMGTDQFGCPDDEGGLDEVTADCFAEAMRGELEAVGFHTDPGQDGLDRRGLIWGGNLAMLCSLLGTPWFPRGEQVKGGLLYLEDVNERPFRIERMLLQLLHAGVLGQQRAVLLGHFTNFKPSPADRGYRLTDAINHLRAATRVPVLTGLPMGHVPLIVTLPFGRPGRLLVDGRQALLGW